MAHLALALLGSIQATLDGEPIQGLQSAHLRALLAYLAVERGHEHARERLASLLWADRSDREALSALRNALSNLRAALGDRHTSTPILLVTRTTIQFNPAGDCWLDVAEFERLLEDAGRPEQSPESCLRLLEPCAALYRGPFLHGLSVANGPAFEEWVLFKGEEYRRSILSVLAQLTSLQLARGEIVEAGRWARRQIDIEPYREHAHRQLMTALALGGERAAALAHYQACRRLLAEELGCEPDDDTQALYTQIRDGGLRQSWPRSQLLPAAHSVTGSELPVPAADSRSPTPFVGREQELARLGSLLDRALAGHGGVALITGEAGEGKTALVDELARQACQAHGDLISLRGNCNAHDGAGDPYLPFREILQTLAGDVEGKRAGGMLSQEQAQRVWAILPVMGAALTERGPGLINSFVPGAAFLRRAEAFLLLEGRRAPPGLSSEMAWQTRLREIVRRADERPAAMPDNHLAVPPPQPDLFAQVTEVLHMVSASRPLLLAVDDVQWADSGTAALLFHLGRRLSGSRILLVCACRSEALHNPPDPKGNGKPIGSVLQQLVREWGDIRIDLDRSDGRAFIKACVDSEPNCLGPAFRQALYTHTGGNALFTVELLRTFQEQGDLTRDEKGRWTERRNLRWESIPPRVEAVVAERVGRLPREGRRLLEAASVEGESFSAEVAARALGAEPSWARQWLSGSLSGESRLVQAIGMQSLLSGGPLLSRYRFAHALFQEYLYSRLDAVDRAHLHGEVGAALEGLCRGNEETLAQASPQLARHYEEAGRALEAVHYHLEAGRWAARLVAYDEAILHLERGLALLEGVPPSAKRLRLELRLCTAIGTPAMLQRGWQAPAYTRALERLSDLVQHPDLQLDPQRLTALSVLALSAGWSTDPGRSERVGEQLLDLAREGSQQALFLGHWALGLSHWLRGLPVTAREHLERALVMYDPEANLPLGGLVVADLGVMARSMLGAVQWQLGYPDQGRASLQQAVAQAQALEQPSSLAFAHFVAAMTTSAVGHDVAAALSHAQALRTLGEVSLVYRAWADMVAGQSQAHRGQARDGFAEPALQEGLVRVLEAGSTWQAAGSGGGYAGLMLLQADVCARAGQIQMALSALDEVQAWIDRTGMQATQADVWRMRGELLLMGRPDRPGQVEEAEACFQKALGIAREQQARLFELKAMVCLARLRQTQGRCDEAREQLIGIYGWFTEGFDAVDLVEAKALLDELA